MILRLFVEKLLLMESSICCSLALVILLLSLSCIVQVI